MQTIDFWLEKASVGDDGGVIRGLGAAFDTPSAYGDLITRGAFAATLAAHAKRGSSPAMLFSHDPEAPIGRWTSLKETDEGLAVEGKVSNATAKSREVRELLKEGALTGLSIGFVVPRGASKFEDDHRIISEVDLHEISVVSTPAVPNARVREVRSFTTPREAEDALREAGFSKRDARAFMAKGWRGIGGDDSAEEIRSALQRIEQATAKLKG